MTDVVTGDAVVLEVPWARYPSRLVARLLDTVIQLALFLAFIFVAGQSGDNLSPAVQRALGITVLVLIVVGYPAIFETLTRGKSPGKMALGLRVVADDGGPERFRQALVRSLAAVIEIYLLAGAPALITSLLNRRGKRLGDLFAGTFVIQERLPRRPDIPPSLAVVPAPLAGWAVHLELSGLTDQAADAAGNYLRRYSDLIPAAQYELGRQIAAAVAAQVSPAPPPGTPPWAFLAAVLAVRREREMSRLAAEQQRWQQRTGLAPAPPAGPPAAPAAPWPAVAAPAEAGPPSSSPDLGQYAPLPLSGRPPAESAAPDSGQFAPPG